MTLRERVERELASTRGRLDDLKRRIDEQVSEIKHSAEGDAYGFTAGLAMHHGALNLTVYGTRFRELQDRASMLEWLLREDEEQGS